MITLRLLLVASFLVIHCGYLHQLYGQTLSADFTGAPVSGPVSLKVDFTDLTTGSPSGWAWYFGDEDFSEITWNQVNAGAAWDERHSHTSVTLPDGSIVVLGGFASGGNRNDVWRSTDKGATWTQQTASASWDKRNKHASVVLPDGSIVLLGGTVANAGQNDVWRSTDKGETWTQMTASAAWQERYNMGCVALSDGTILVMGGRLDGPPFDLNDIWKSTDKGATWTLVNDNPGWSDRSEFGSLVLPNGKILIMGGDEVFEGYKNDVWQSSDNGATWTLVNAAAPWTARTHHSVHLIPDGSIFLMLGVVENPGYLSDIWRSGDDGATWSQVSDDIPPDLSGSRYHSTAMLPDGDIILTGGENDQLLFNNTVWQYSTATSALQNPSHVYTSPGDYQVTLQAWSATEVSTERKAGYVTAGEADECSRKSLLFNGVDEYVALNPFWATSPESLSVEAWVYPTSGADEVILYHGEKGEFLLVITSNTIKMRINTVTTGWLEVEMSGVEINEWMHVCGAWHKGDKLCLYINGVLQDQIIVPNEFLADPGAGFGHCLGAYNAASGWYNGELDEIRIWSKALNQNEIRTSMHTMQSNTEAGLQYYWPVISESGTTLLEIASGGNHGTLQNMDNSAWVSSGAPLGGGSTALNIINSTGTHVLSDQHLEMEFVEKTGTDTIVVSHINCAPNVLPATGEVLTTDQYWVVNHYGQGSFNTNLTFTDVPGLTADDEAMPLQIVLFSRESNSDGSWTALTSAGQVDAANNTVTFTGITGFSQFSIGRMSTRKVYVKHNATGNNDGTSWTDAYTSLQTSLDNVVARDVIWVAAGTYTPTYDYGLGIGTRGNHFRMVDNVHIYGGFAGNEPEDYNLSLRDFETNTTYLSADINGDDDYTGASWTGTSENCYHVLYHSAGLNLTNAARLDGFTLSGGNANAGSEPHHSGGGIYNKENNPVFANLKVENNFANNAGGGIFLEESHSVIIGQSTFHNNETRTAASGFSGAGGGMYCRNSSPEITNSSFSQNTSYYGGGILCSGNSSPSFTNLLVTNNEAVHGGGMYLSGYPEKIVNVTIARNSASSGGGVYASNTEAEFNNAIIYENTATSSGHQFAVISADIALNYSCYSNETGDIALSGSNPEFNADINSITVKPGFISPRTGDFRLRNHSSCINTGNNSYNTEATDIRGQARIQDGTIDMGAYEFTSGLDPENYILYVKDDATGFENGTNWEDAFTLLQEAINSAETGDQVWVAAGTYYPTEEAGSTGERYKAFQPKEGVEVYGGFAGNEASDFDTDNRDLLNNETILSGDIGVPGQHDDNCYRVVYISSGMQITAASVLDGFTITESTGPAIVLVDADPTLRNLKIVQNYGGNSGGIHFTNASPNISNILIADNSGSGFYFMGDSAPVINNATIAMNTSGYGGGIYYNGSPNPPPTFNNCIIWGNTASANGNQIFSANSAAINLNNCCYANGEYDISGPINGSGNITDDPLFLDALNSDYRIFGASPCVDTGNNSYNDLETDIRGVGFVRKQDKTAGASGIIDMGAYEYTPGTDKDAPLIWTGNTSADWNTASNWDKNIVPDPDEYVIVPSEPANQPHISSAPETPSVCQALTIQSGAVVTIDEGKALTVPGSITNNNGTNGLILKSDNTGTASLIHYNTDVEATAQRYIHQYLTDATGWHYLSSPVVQQPIRPEFVADSTPHADDDFYKFSEPDYLWINTKVEGGTWNPEFEADFVVGRGYNVAYAENQTKSFEGNLNVGDYTFDGTTTPAITYTAGGGSGWNLMGNPYPSGLDWDLCQRTNIDGAVYVYDGDNGQYVSWNGTVGALSEGIIPPMNGFFIKASENPAFAIPNSARVHTSTNFLKSKGAVPDLLVLQVEGKGFSDKTYIHFNPEATTNFDRVFDAYKLLGVEAAPQLYTKSGNTKLSINVLPYSAEEITIPLSLMVGQDGEYTISVVENTFWETVDISLKDLKTQIAYDLRSNTQVTFNVSTANPDRFLLLINGVTGMEENIPGEDGIDIYSYGDQVFIKTDEPGEVAVHNLLGQLLATQTLTVHEVSALSGFTTGFYLITVRTDKAFAAKKVFVR